MKKIYLLFFVLLSSFSIISAQNAADYFFSFKNNVALENISSGSVTLFGSDAVEESSSIIDLPFTFRFANREYNKFSVSTNGTLGLGDTIVSPYSFDFQLIQSLTYPLISPWGDVLTTGSNGEIKYKIVTQISGLRKLVVEWNVRNYTDDRPEYNKTFQAWLFEGSNKVQFVYGSAAPYDYDNSSIGIASSKTDYEVVNSDDNTVSNSNPYVINHTWPGQNNSYSFSPLPEIVQLPPITVDENGSVTNVSCNGASNGAITLGTISGGDGSYTVNFTGPNGPFTGQTISGLSAGVYTYTITDGSETTPVTGQIVITEPSILSASVISVTNASCGRNGAVVVAATGGTAPYTYTLNDSTNTTGIFNNVPAGSYTVNVRDNNGCTTSVATTVSQPSTLTESITVKNASCSGEKNGSITATATGGTSPYSYTISGSAITGTYPATNTTGIFNNLSAGNYVVTVKDASGCTVSASATVGQPTATTSVTNVTCYGSSNGSATVTLTGTTTASYIVWFNSKGKIVGAGNSINNVPADTYTVIVYNSSCPVSAQATVSQPRPVTASAAVTSNYHGAQISCANSNNGVVKITAAGGSGSYLYSLYTSSNNVTTNSTGIFTNLAAATYNYVVKDVKGCTPVSGTVKVTAPTPVAAVVSMTPAYPAYGGQKYTIYIGYGAQSVTLSASVTGGTPGYSYLWSPAIGLSSTNTASTVASPKVTTTYKVTITDANGCTTSKSITVNVVYFNWSSVTREASESQSINTTDAVIADNVSGTTTEMKLNVYPNPSVGQFNVQLSGYTSSKVTVTVLSETGKTVAQQVIGANSKVQTATFNLTNEAPGLYIVKVMSEKGVQTSKVVIGRK